MFLLLFQVIFELITTERDYVSDLSMVVEHFLNPIRDRNLLSKEDIGHLFLNIQKLCEVNKDFLGVLDALQVWLFLLVSLLHIFNYFYNIFLVIFLLLWSYENCLLIYSFIAQQKAVNFVVGEVGDALLGRTDSFKFYAVYCSNSQAHTVSKTIYEEITHHFKSCMWLSILL